MPRCALMIFLVAAATAGADRVNPPLENHLFGTRSQAMAGAVVVAGEGIQTLFCNPAGFRVRARTQACAGLLSLPYRRQAMWAGAVMPRGPWGFSVIWGSTSVTDIVLRDRDGQQTGTGGWQRHRISVGCARALDFLTYVGSAVRYIHVDAEGMSARGVGVDIGIVKLILPPLLAVGGSVNDALTSVSYHGDTERHETLRPRYTGGISIGLAEGKLRLEWNLYKRRDWRAWRALVGVEAKVGRGLVARVGYGAGGVTAGVGLSSGRVGVGLAAIPDALGGAGHGVEAIWTR